MAKYYYNKYNSVLVNIGPPVFKNRQEGWTADNNYAITVYDSWTYDSNLRKIIGTGPKATTISGLITDPSNYNKFWIEANSYFSTCFKRSLYGAPHIGADVWECPTGYVKAGLVTSNIIAEDGTYPEDGRHTDGFWYVKGILVNTIPTVSGTDATLGDKNTPFSFAYQVSDTDATNNLTVTEKLNGAILRTISNAPKATDINLDITKALFDSLNLNSINTITIEVNDGAGGVAYRNYTFTKTNTAPSISDIDKDLGVLSIVPSQVYQISDNEGDAVTVTEKIDNVVIRTFTATPNTDYTLTIPESEWFKLAVGTHSLRIEAVDARGGSSVRIYTFTRTDDKIKFELKTPFATDIKATKILVSPTWTIPTGATAKVEACNNAFDAVPTWEDITSQVLINRHYNFINDIKTALQWGISVRFTIEKGSATSQIILDGFGGAFE
ncbi:hypothetical protein EUAN_12260 [Andreesenia angusta]|uniref:Uncharacterized protein n=1 Tax=Andreesenia angusta TaxID=39480 RepID=A0A1S1V7N0_9FIRM|nr:hypothetical protein [Andreesenia angusta]OHW62157.1 hypothetical protein EUAN_12260 [Andreesenia angusta]